MQQHAEIVEHLTPPPPAVRNLDHSQKAAVVVRLLQAEGAMPRLSRLEPMQQARLVRRIGSLSHVNRATVMAVVREFAQALDDLALTFPRGIRSALELVGEELSDEARDAIELLAEEDGPTDPWTKLSAMEADQLRPLIEGESAEVCAIMLAKLPAAKAAALLGELPEERAYIVAHAVSLTGSVDPETIERVGASLLGQLSGRPTPAFGGSATERVGAILNAASSLTRDKVLEGLDERDAIFAEGVRKAIFTFEHIPKRVESKDVPRVMRGVDGEAAIVALAAGLQTAPIVVEFLLENMSKRMAEQLREDAEARGSVRAADGEAAMAEIVTSIRELAEAGEIRLIEDEEE